MDTPSLERIFVVDLSDGEITREPIPDPWQERYVGGKGLGARYLYDRVPPGADPFGAENVLLFLVGPLTGYLPGDGRFTAVTKSPLTGLFLDSYAGGSFASSFRATFPTVAGISLTGSSDELQVLDLRGEGPSLIDGSSYAGAPVDDVENAFSDASVLSIGPAGENGVTFATIAADGGEHHAGRGGAGAVMGSKGLKAVVVPYRNSLAPPNEAIRELQIRTRNVMKESPYGVSYRHSGTLESVEFAEATGMLSSEGWRDRGFTGTSEIGLDAVREASTGRENENRDFPGDFRVESDDGETVLRGGTPIALGANLGLDEFDSVASLGVTCDRLGLDVISVGNAIALGMIASDRGVVDRVLSFGNESDAKSLLEEIATGSSELGRILGQGVERAAVDLGLEGAIPTVKAMAVPSFDPRGVPAMALAYATSDRGACHRRSVPATVQVFESSWSPRKTARAIITEQDKRAALWCLIVDDLTTPLVPDLGQEWLAALGYDVETEDLREIGERTWTLTRLFNVREGTNRDDDGIPSHFVGTNGIDEAWFQMALTRYYELREWDSCGRPRRKLLERLDLDWVVDSRKPADT